MNCHQLKIQTVFMKWDKIHSWNSLQAIWLSLYQIQQDFWFESKNCQLSATPKDTERTTWPSLACDFIFSHPIVFSAATISFFTLSDQKSCLQLNCSKYQGDFFSTLRSSILFKPFFCFLSFFHDFSCQAEYLLSCSISFIAESSLYYWQNVNLVLISCHARLHCLLMSFALSTHKPVPLWVPLESQSQRK